MTSNSALSTYQQARAQLLELMAEMAALRRPGLRPEPELAGKLAAERFELLVVGHYKRGKTCLINALIRDDLLPTSVIPATSVLTVLSYGAEVSIEVLYKDGSVGQIGRERLAEFVTESGNPENHRGVRELLIRHPAPLLKGGVRIIDTPGIGSLHRHNTAAAYAALPRCDAALFLLAADQPLGQAELEFLDDLRPHARRLFFLLNKIDLLSPAELAEAEQFTRRELARAIDGDVQLFPVSARHALSGGRSWVDAGLERQSRIAQFRAELESFLLHEKGRVLLASIAAALVQTLHQGKLELRLERQALHTPADRLNHAIQQFEKRHRNLRTEWQELAYHITMASERLASRLGERLLEIGLPDLKRRLLAEFDRRAREHRDLNPKRLDEDLSGFIERRVGHCYAEWAEREKQQLAQELGALAADAVHGAAGLTAELQHYSAELLAADSEFRIDSLAASPLPTGERAPLLTPAGFDLLADGLWLDLPRWIGGRFARIRSTLDRWARRRVIERRRSELAELSDMAAGRIRGSLVDHIQRETGRSLAALSEQLEKTAAGIERALEQGRRRRSEQAESLAEHLAQLTALQDQVDSCISRVERILNDVERM